MAFRQIALICLLTSASIGAAAEQPARTSLPTGQNISPLAAPGAKFTPLVAHAGPRPEVVVDGAAAIAVSPDKRRMLVLTSGYNRFNGPDGKVVPAQSTQYIFVYAIDANGTRRLQTLQISNSFGGIAWLPKGNGFVVGGGVDDALYVFARIGSGFQEVAKIPLGHKAGLGAGVLPQAAGVAVSPDGRHVLVANYYNDSVSLLDLGQKRVIAEQDLRPGKIDASASGVPGGEFPFGVAWTGANQVWVSSPRDRQLLSLTVVDGTVRVTARVKTIGEPTALLAGRRDHMIFATEDNDDRVAILDSVSGRLVAEPRLNLPTALAAPALGKGLNPNALEQLPDGRLLVTLGGINAVAVVDQNSITALVPTAWYPSAVAAANGRVFVANRKSPPGPNPQGCAPRLAIYRGQPNACGAANQYIFQMEKAGLLDFPLPDARQLAKTTIQVGTNIGLPGADRRAAAEATMASIRAKVKHVIFIIKENRTYDQVLGDLPIGNGDPHLAILGRALSPNHHRLARQFVTFDNFFDSGEQSSTGWTWSTAGRTTDLLEKTAPVNYADRGLAYESEEADRFIYEQQTNAERQSTNPALSRDPELLPGPALLTAPDPDDDHHPNTGYLWDAAIRAGISLRNYGFADASIYEAGLPGSVPVVREPYKEHRRVYTAGDRLLAPFSDPYFRGFDQKLADYWRVLEWQREYDEEEASGMLPQLTLLRISHDHFGEFDKAIDGVNTVETEMADNDYALGLIVEHVARSNAGNSTLIFVIEDDAQNGADHVDARRSIAFIVGPYVRHAALVSTRYTTLNILRTIEAVLGLQPLGLNDALAMPMADAFDLANGQWSYRAEAADVLRSTRLPISPERFVATTSASRLCPQHHSAYWSAAMEGQDFSKEDRLDSEAFNAALWRGLGSGSQSLPRQRQESPANRQAETKRSAVLPCLRVHDTADVK